MHPLLTPAWIAKHLFALLILVMMMWLGFWQLDRLQQRRERNVEQTASVAQNPTTFTGNEPDPQSFNDRRVRVTGIYVNDESVVLRNQDFNGTNGVHLLTPLRIEGSDNAVMIDRGWLPPDQTKPEQWATYAVSDTVMVEGIAHREQPRPDALLTPLDAPLPGENKIDAWIRVDVAKMQQQIDVPLLPIFIEELPEDPPLSDVLPRPRDPTFLDEGPHLTYALQWFAFSGILVTIYANLIRQELKKPRSLSEQNTVVNKPPLIVEQEEKL